MKKIYILHGWSYTKDKWEPMIWGLGALGYQVVFPDIPGLTGTLDKPWELSHYMHWLRDILREEKEPVVLLGHSNGGRIAISYTAKYPEKVSELILVDSAGVYHDDFFTNFKKSSLKTIAKAGKVFTKSETLRKVLYKLIGVRDYERANPIMRETMRNLIKVDSLPDAKKINAPVLLIWGSGDKVTPLSDGKILADTFPNAELHIVEGALHSPQITHSADVLSIIQKYYENNI
ncbi:MAG: alpha/beta hydrolase [Candidatus Pacebacteria bacterium]|nr:alpha/beta hydrolase [Candidatus Paceibacterota bacterium]